MSYVKTICASFVMKIGIPELKYQCHTLYHYLAVFIKLVHELYGQPLYSTWNYQTYYSENHLRNNNILYLNFYYPQGIQRI
jgi:hypothetical protein